MRKFIWLEFGRTQGTVEYVRGVGASRSEDAMMKMELMSSLCSGDKIRDGCTIVMPTLTG